MFTCHIPFVKRKYPGGTSTENTHSKLSPEVIHPQAMQRTMGSMQIPPLASMNSCPCFADRGQELRMGSCRDIVNDTFKKTIELKPLLSSLRRRRTLKPGSHLCDKHKHKHKHKLATFPHVKQAQENMAYASAVTLEEIWKYSRWRMKCLCLSHAGSHL